MTKTGTSRKTSKSSKFIEMIWSYGLPKEGWPRPIDEILWSSVASRFSSVSGPMNKRNYIRAIRHLRREYYYFAKRLDIPQMYYAMTQCRPLCAYPKNKDERDGSKGWSRCRHGQVCPWCYAERVGKAYEKAVVMFPGKRHYATQIVLPLPEWPRKEDIRDRSRHLSRTVSRASGGHPGLLAMSVRIMEPPGSPGDYRFVLMGRLLTSQKVEVSVPSGNISSKKFGPVTPRAFGSLFCFPAKLFEVRADVAKYYVSMTKGFYLCRELGN